mmetsp:Transcript_17258/g.23757  ORF Transcript_17258/g.23757 Transcript_17258/m.23757 type:complete len:235 (-) Transcript_17258:114-818(-)|eukprot:CAMPEP_0185730188 /NCGR_PEP_ID=MMETSP1171-20130828/8807_1 /TAXON_ID=374046 /ORGANISM="Helicotheca tamensis, Strain CCMP826" /LENGTH=234 /DNA_ID=CAMNT_0028399189 /DNA_START=57 /DNA_END=761 /DNA_ORIENTATION=-
MVSISITAFAPFLLLISPWLAYAADVTINSFACNHELNIYATEFEMTCGGDGCTMGDMVNYQGKVMFSGVKSKDAYLTLSLKKYGLAKEFYYRGEKVNLCARVSSNNGGCYADGLYTFISSDTLPTLNDKDWFLTGSNFNAQLDIYSDSSLTNMIGTCRANIDAKVTTGAAKYFNPPSATRTGLIFLGIIAGFSMITTCMCLWMDNQEKRKLDRGGKEQHGFVNMDGQGDKGVV